MIKDYFLILQVHYLASDEIIRVAYKKLCQSHHPDLGGKSSDFHDIQEAYDTLMDPLKKEAYTKVWMKQYVHEEHFHLNELKDSFYNITLFHIKKVLINYLECIRDSDYEQAYGLLSQGTRRHLFEKDFISWQNAILKVHQILEFDCFVNQVHTSGNHNPEIWFKVKIKEYNHVLHRVEEDYFERVLVFEDNVWRLKLKAINVKTVIRKYNKIVTLNKKNKKQFHKLLPQFDDHRLTKMLSKKYFISNCEYEWLRFKRYKNIFSILAVSCHKLEDASILDEVISKETRDIDSFCLYGKSKYYILLPETPKTWGASVATKISRQMKGRSRAKLSFKISQVNDQYGSIKEMLDRLK